MKYNYQQTFVLSPNNFLMNENIYQQTIYLQIISTKKSFILSKPH